MKDATWHYICMLFTGCFILNGIVCIFYLTWTAGLKIFVHYISMESFLLFIKSAKSSMLLSWCQNKRKIATDLAKVFICLTLAKPASKIASLAKVDLEIYKLSPPFGCTWSKSTVSHSNLLLWCISGDMEFEKLQRFQEINKQNFKTEFLVLMLVYSLFDNAVKMLHS